MEQLSLSLDSARQGLPTSPDIELEHVAAAIRALDPDGSRFATVLRNTIDQLLDGENTGRYDWKDLMKTEKTHAGTLVEINLQRAFKFGDGIDMDYSIAGIDVDAKYSQKFGGWMIPPEAKNHLCLLVWADDYKSIWSAGLIRIGESILNTGGNRDSKATIRADARKRITWLWHNCELPENVLLHIDPLTRSRIFLPADGQQRVNELFRSVHGRRVGRGVVRTVARQSDYMARVREGKGRARTVLRDEGIIILGGFRAHQKLALDLGGPVPRPGEFVAHPVMRARPEHKNRPRAEIAGELWVVAEPGETRDKPAPVVQNPQRTHKT
ncbi:NaeI family type II restriction endonuclease [Nocardia huaxiensis]|uniref:NaeI family type II restriction endonuclease n=1 Tax=Nocardia huaxiensis TaxID=2755382 RepID=UPI001C67A8DA|nr:NaeI family type II restriction endonuclease [Nocardia huaxiensis]